MTRCAVSPFLQVQKQRHLELLHIKAGPNKVSIGSDSPSVTLPTPPERGGGVYPRPATCALCGSRHTSFSPSLSFSFIRHASSISVARAHPPTGKEGGPSHPSTSPTNFHRSPGNSGHHTEYSQDDLNPFTNNHSSDLCISSRDDGALQLEQEDPTQYCDHIDHEEVEGRTGKDKDRPILLSEHLWSPPTSPTLRCSTGVVKESRSRQLEAEHVLSGARSPPASPSQGSPLMSQEGPPRWFSEDEKRLLLNLSLAP